MVAKAHLILPNEAEIARSVAGLEPMKFTKNMVLADVLDVNTQALTQKRNREFGFVPV